MKEEKEFHVLDTILSAASQLASENVLSLMLMLNSEAQRVQVSSLQFHFEMIFLPPRVINRTPLAS